jgi:putative membrane protein
MKIPLVLAALTLGAASALAQTTPAQTPAQTAPDRPAPAQNAPSAANPANRNGQTGNAETRRAVNSAPLENGANSFTEGQASERLREAGISNVTGLRKDDNGVWRGRGQWQGRSVEVGLDFRGNIQAR